MKVWRCSERVLVIGLRVACLQLAVFGFALLGRREGPVTELPDSVVAAASPEAPSGEAAAEMVVEGLASERPSVNQTPQKLRDYVVRSGDTLGSIMASLGQSRDCSERISRVMMELGVSPAKLAVGETLSIVQDSGGRILSLEKMVSYDKKLIVTGDDDAEFSGRVVALPLRTVRRVLTATVESSVAQAAQVADIPYELVDAVADIFDDEVAFHRDIQPGDTLVVSSDEFQDEQGTVVFSGPLEAASLKQGGRIRAGVRFVGPDGKPRYYNEEGRLRGGYFLKYPVSFTRISSIFTDDRLHPISKKKQPHLGIDFAAPVGTPVRSVGDGVIVQAGFGKAEGNWIKVRHDVRYSTVYLHLSRIASSVKRGVRVPQGEVIGYVGSTGKSTGPHLHYGLFDKGQYVNPLAAEIQTTESSESVVPREVLASALRELSISDSRLALNKTVIQKKG